MTQIKRPRTTRGPGGYGGQPGVYVPGRGKKSPGGGYGGPMGGGYQSPPIRPVGGFGYGPWTGRPQQPVSGNAGNDVVADAPSRPGGFFMDWWKENAGRFGPGKDIEAWNEYHRNPPPPPPNRRMIPLNSGMIPRPNIFPQRGPMGGGGTQHVRPVGVYKGENDWNSQPGQERGPMVMGPNPGMMPSPNMPRPRVQIGGGGFGNAPRNDTRWIIN